MTNPSVFGASVGRTRLGRIACLFLIALGWAGLASLCHAGLVKSPPAAGFDLQLLLDAGRRFASGGSPYDPNGLASGLAARDLFYSYPPLVAQVLAPLSGLPGWVLLAASWIGAAAGLAIVAGFLARPGNRIDVALVTMAVVPYFLPFSVGLIFGNVDTWFPFLLGAVVVAICAPEWGAGGGRRTPALAGIALAVASAVKIHPASILIWLAVLVVRRGGAVRSRALGVLAWAVAAGIAILVVSLLAGGLGPWQQYPEYLRLGSNADLASRVNIGPASQLGLLLGESIARPAALIVAVVALTVTALAACFIRDPLESIAWAFVASLVVLPVTWYHYPVALVPVAVALWARSLGTPAAKGVVAALCAVYVAADLAVVLPVTSWVSVGMLLATAHWAARRRPEPLRFDRQQPAQPSQDANEPESATAI